MSEPITTADIVREFERNNFHHVNDTDPDKVWSSEWCARVAELALTYSALKAEVERLKATRIDPEQHEKEVAEATAKHWRRQVAAKDAEIERLKASLSVYFQGVNACMKDSEALTREREINRVLVEALEYVRLSGTLPEERACEALAKAEEMRK